MATYVPGTIQLQRQISLTYLYMHSSPVSSSSLAFLVTKLPRVRIAIIQSLSPAGWPVGFVGPPVNAGRTKPISIGRGGYQRSER